MADGKKYDLRERLFAFAKRIVDIVKLLPRTPECDVIRKQLMAAGTSIGANYEEADGAVSKKDFVNKMAISRKEANETKYWLSIVSGSFLKPEVVKADIQEAGEIVRILSSIINKARK